MIRLLSVVVSTAAFLVPLAAQSWRPLTPQALAPRMVGDAARQRLVLVDLSGDAWAHTAAGWRQLQPATPLPPADWLDLAYDLNRDRVMAVQFTFGQATMSLWEFDGATWRLVATLPLSPSLDGIALAFDQLRARTVLVASLRRQASQVFEYDGTTLVQMPNGPFLPGLPSMAYDVLNGRAMLDAGGPNTWSYDGLAWSTHPRPPFPGLPGLAYDLASLRTVMVAGQTFTFDGTNWTPAGALPGSGWAMAFDFGAGRLRSFGHRSRSELWEFDGTNWQEVEAVPMYTDNWSVVAAGESTLLFEAAGPAMIYTDRWQTGPAASTSPVRAAGYAWDPTARVVWSFGGVLPDQTYSRDTRRFDGQTWSSIATPTLPPNQFGAKLAFDSWRQRLVLWGNAGQTWEFDGADWAQQLVASPPARSEPTLVFDASRGRTVMFGGRAGAAYLGDTWEYDGAWREVVTATAPSPRSRHGMAFSAQRGRVLLSGGRDATSTHDDTWQYDGAWTQLLPDSGAMPRTTDSTCVLSAATSSGQVLRVIGADRVEPLSAVLELPAAASFATLGRGCSGSAGEPTLRAVGGAVPSLGAGFQLQLGALPPRPGFAWLGFGLDLAAQNGLGLPAALDAAGLPGCQLWTAVAFGFLVPHVPGVQQLTIGIPSDPALAGLVLGAQALVFDAQAPNGVGAVTNAGVLVLQ